MTQGPNVKRLIVRKMALLMIPAGSKRALLVGVEAIVKPGNLQAMCGEATEWVEQAIALVKAAPDNTWGDDDEAIAGEILKGIEERKRQQFMAANKLGEEDMKDDLVWPR